MKSPLCILHLEDDPNDAALVQSTLEAGGIACTTTCVQTRADFLAALENGEFDLILSDYSMPAFDGFSALKIARAEQPDLPVIFVSGTLGEELAIDSLKNGATDYVLKERLARLAPAVLRAMEEVEARAERQRLEERLIEAQKMDVIGQLAGGVAHDFNNVLGVIIGYNDLMLPELDSESLPFKCAEEIRLASERAAGLTRQLLVFSRKQTVQPIELNLDDEVQDLDQMLRRLIGANIEMTIVPGKQNGWVKADPGYIGQMLMNLVVNARDAMPHGGKLTIALNNVTLDENHASAHPGETSGNFVMLSVTDTGTGITDEVKPHLFETFFTTKPVGKGTGLGLATCQSIVRQSGGQIAVHSEVGKGTTFKIYFPRVEEPLDAASRPIQTGPLPPGTETVMIVEDEPSLRDLVRCILEAQGYEVLTASNGQEALDMAREHKGSPIRLVVSDVIMPLMGGREMADWLKTTHPDVKILFTSGYADDAIAHHGVLDAGVELISKPYTPAALARRVRTLLDDRNVGQGDTEIENSDSTPIAAC